MQSDGKAQLFCTAFAGGTASDFQNIIPYLKKDLQVVTLEYAGHGKRREEAFYATFDDMVEDVLEQVRERRDSSVPYMFLGYSLGALVTYEVLKRYWREDSQLIYTFIAAHTPPDFYGDSHDYWKLEDVDFIKKIEKFGGINTAVFKDLRFASIFLRPIRADYRLLGQYYCGKAAEKLHSDATVFYCDKDIPYEELRGWSAFFDRSCQFYELGENHFFIKSHAQEMASVILKEYTMHVSQKPFHGT